MNILTCSSPLLPFRSESWLRRPTRHILARFPVLRVHIPLVVLVAEASAGEVVLFNFFLLSRYLIIGSRRSVL